ncbi:MAG: sigma-70 family RNA polymerase sigma factor, partial [Candidatus Hydrogenedentes bacterium]|nr:sigma-70 family RNA polymerase sigma factor [Candidatus Hydrogenedentota bacterium]
MDTDLGLLESWWARRDGEAFNEIVTRYSGLVYGACLRVLGNPSDAEDLAQECFLWLAEHPVEIRSSLGGWLHRMATRRALDAYRSRARRLSRDTRFAESTPEASVPDDLTWHEIRALVDEAIDSLPDELREVIVAHFIERRTQQAIAEELGVARRTVINRIQKGIDSVRTTLSKRGVVVGETALLALFGCRLAEAAPARLLSELGHLAIAGTAGKATTAAWGAGVAGGIVVMKKSIMGVAVLASVLLAGWYLASGGDTVPQHARDTGPAPSPPEPEDRQRASLDTTQLAGAMETALGNVRPDRESIDAPSEGAVVEGIVRDQQGRPVADASIHIADNPTQDNVLDKPPVTHTDSGGRFRITHVNPEVHMVFADHPAYAPGWTGIEPKADTTAQVEILLTRGGAIEGVVTSGGIPQADAFVSAWLD